MFINVDLPAPFSPSSAWNSPRRSGRWTASLAVSAPKRLVMPRSSRASSAAPDASVGVIRRQRTTWTEVLLAGDRVRRRDRAVLQLGGHGVELRLVLGTRRADLADARAAVGDLERRVR